MHPEQELLRQIVLWICSRYRKSVSNLSGKLGDLHENISTTYASFDERELEKLLAQKDQQKIDFLEHKKFLFMEPCKEAGCMLPIMSLKYDFARSIPEVRLRLALFLMDDKHEIKALGYRFESPEGEGKHHYYHAQLIKTFEKDNLRLTLPCPEWLPVKQPAFALDAQNGVALLIGLLISLYGSDHLLQLQNDEARLWSSLKDYVEKMAFKDRKFQPTYWQMRLAKGMIYYKTWEDVAKFKAIMKKGANPKSR